MVNLSGVTDAFDNGYDVDVTYTWEATDVPSGSGGQYELSALSNSHSIDSGVSGSLTLTHNSKQALIVKLRRLDVDVADISLGAGWFTPWPQGGHTNGSPITSLPYTMEFGENPTVIHVVTTAGDPEYYGDDDGFSGVHIYLEEVNGGGTWRSEVYQNDYGWGYGGKIARGQIYVRAAGSYRFWLESVHKGPIREFGGSFIDIAMAPKLNPVTKTLISTTTGLARRAAVENAVQGVAQDDRKQVLRESVVATEDDNNAEELRVSTATLELLDPVGGEEFFKDYFMDETLPRAIVVARAITIFDPTILPMLLMIKNDETIVLQLKDTDQTITLTKSADGTTLTNHKSGAVVERKGLLTLDFGSAIYTMVFLGTGDIIDAPTGGNGDPYIMTLL